MSLYQLGDAISDFVVSDINGNAQPISQVMGQRGLMLFLLRGTWCPSCLMQIRATQRYYNHYLNHGIQSLFITAEEPDTVWTFRISQARTLPFGIHPDPCHTILSRFLPAAQITLLPAAYLVTPGKQIVWQYLGKHVEDRPTTSQLVTAFEQYLPMMVG
jgi:peroxiredoxin